MTETQRINKRIAENAPLPIEKIIALEVKEFKSSPFYQTMLAARRYYENRNDVNQKKRFYIHEGTKRVDENVVNNKVSHPFVRQLTDQKVQYLLSNDWSVDHEAVPEVLNDAFRLKLQTAVRDSVLCGIGWLFLTLEDNAFVFRRYPSEEIVPLWVDNQHEELESVIRIYAVVEYVGEQKKVVEYAEHWTLDGVATYRKEGDAYLFVGQSPHLSMGNVGYNWEKIPFIPIRYNDDEISLLLMVKPMVDEYDKTVSVTADLISDLTNKTLVVTGVGTDIEVREFSENRKLYRTSFLPEGATLQEVGTEPDITSSIAHQNQMRANIYEFGRGVDYNANIGLNASGEARKYLYANLDLDCNQLEAGVLSALLRIIWFLNHNPAKVYGIPEDAKIEFSRNMMINTTEIIDNAVKAQGITGVAMSTVVGLLPFVENPEEEIAKWKEEQAAVFEEQQSMIGAVDNRAYGGGDDGVTE